jgi:hypothetical protein
MQGLLACAQSFVKSGCCETRDSVVGADRWLVTTCRLFTIKIHSKELKSAHLCHINRRDSLNWVTKTYMHVVQQITLGCFLFSFSFRDG